MNGVHKLSCRIVEQCYGARTMKDKKNAESKQGYSMLPTNEARNEPGTKHTTKQI